MSFLVAISVGNTRTAVGHFHGDRVHGVERFANDDMDGIVRAAEHAW